MTRVGQWRGLVDVRRRNADGLVDVLEAVGARAPVAPVAPTGPVSDALYARLSADQVAALEAGFEGNIRQLWDDLPPSERRRLVVSAAAFYHATDALATMGLTSADPPEDVHSMARGPLTAGGDLGMADFVIQTLQDAGIALDPGATVLDFGCSSGRALRPIAAWRADLECLGCDPNAPAIAWAQAALPMARWFVSPTAPPLDLEDQSVDLVYAISIWSHFSADAAVRWLGEMHRIVKPGGSLLLTTHGLNTFATYVHGDMMGRRPIASAIGTMLRDGIEFVDVFGEAGDWGVKDPGWGNSFLLADWLVEHATPQWAVLLLRSGGLQSNQDVFVLERRP